jgi:hypothetical protein
VTDLLSRVFESPKRISEDEAAVTAKTVYLRTSRLLWCACKVWILVWSVLSEGENVRSCLKVLGWCEWNPRGEEWSRLNCSVQINKAKCKRFAALWWVL